MIRLYPLCILLSIAGAGALGAQQAVKPDSARRAAHRDAIVRLRHAPGAAAAAAGDRDARAAALRRVLGDRAAAAAVSGSVAPTDSSAERRAREAAIESARRARPR